MRTSIPDAKRILEHLTETQTFLKVNFIVPNNFKVKISDFLDSFALVLKRRTKLIV